jgi:hypothetical protein
MKNQLLFLFALLVSIIGHTQSVGDTFVDNFITYEITSLSPDEVEINSYDANGGTVVSIPQVVTNSSTSYNVTSIGTSAFNGRGLTSVTIPDTVTIINIGAFLQNSLTSITIPDSVTFIGNFSFKSNQITSVVIPSGAVAGFESFKDNVLTNVSFEDGVTSINPNAFENNQITSIIIPSSVTFIGSLAFAGNPLTNVTSLATIPPTITTTPGNGGADTFAADRSNIALHIPAGTIGAYVTDPGALWTGFNPVTEDALSIDEFELANSVKVITYADAINIVTENNLQFQDYTMYSISGMEIATGKESHIPTGTFASGIYILKLNFDRGTAVKKVIIN